MHEIISKNKKKETHTGPICLCYPNRIFGKIHKSAFSSLFKRKRTQYLLNDRNGNFSNDYLEKKVTLVFFLLSIFINFFNKESQYLLNETHLHMNDEFLGKIKY